MLRTASSSLLSEDLLVSDHSKYLSSTKLTAQDCTFLGKRYIRVACNCMYWCGVMSLDRVTVECWGSVSGDTRPGDNIPTFIPNTYCNTWQGAMAYLLLCLQLFILLPSFHCQNPRHFRIGVIQVPTPTRDTFVCPLCTTPTLIPSRTRSCGWSTGSWRATWWTSCRRWPTCPTSPTSWCRVWTTDTASILWVAHGMVNV